LRILPDLGRGKTVSLDITPAPFAFYDKNMKKTAEPGGFDVVFGNFSREADSQKVIFTVGK
jgi:hypothetical protein